jgi:ABC-type maltose transport system permease subunit
MPVRFNGKKDLIGMLLMFAIFPTIALFGALFMSSDLRWLFLLVILLIIVFVIVNKYKKKN